MSITRLENPCMGDDELLSSPTGTLCWFADHEAEVERRVAEAVNLTRQDYTRATDQLAAAKAEIEALRGELKKSADDYLTSIGEYGAEIERLKDLLRIAYDAEMNDQYLTPMWEREAKAALTTAKPTEAGNG